MIFCIRFNVSVLYPFEVFVNISKTLNLMQQLFVSYIHSSDIHSILLTVKLLSALWPLLHEILNTVMTVLMNGKCL